ncbi:MAG: hypothetical protein HKN41_04225, partial [Ilumatobacter sp.]|nr:hypothetical protein [Ilumatobacter sp.]
FGSSLVDATLSIGIGPVIRPIDVSNSAIASVAIVAAGIAVTTFLVGRRSVVTARLGLELLVVYAVCSTAFVALAWGG